jgi:membrane AbrB-like protein
MQKRFKYFIPVSLTLLLALCATLLCVGLGTPLPWMIGPLLATALATIFRQPTQSAVPLRNAAQCTLGAALGLYFTPAITTLVLSLWWAIAIGVVWSLLLGWAFGWWLHKLNAPHFRGLSRSTTWFAGAIGGASEMTLLAERVHARTDLVAASHSLRLLLVTVMVPFGMQFSGLHGLDLLNTGAREVSPMGLAVLGGTTALGAWAMDRLGRANPWFLGALLVSMGFAMAGVELTAIPKPLSNAAQLVIGVSLGVRFTPAFVHTAPRWLASVAAGTVVMIALCVGFGLLVAWATDLHPATMVLATAPGGIAEMAITAKVLQLGAPVVTAFQVCRLMAVLLIVQPIHTWLYAGKDASRDAT